MIAKQIIYIFFNYNDVKVMSGGGACSASSIYHIIVNKIRIVRFFFFEI